LRDGETECEHEAGESDAKKNDARSCRREIVGEEGGDGQANVATPLTSLGGALPGSEQMDKTHEAKQ
jgi:hypothetical protein